MQEWAVCNFPLAKCWTHLSFVCCLKQARGTEPLMDSAQCVSSPFHYKATGNFSGKEYLATHPTVFWPRVAFEVTSEGSCQSIDC